MSQPSHPVESDSAALRVISTPITIPERVVLILTAAFYTWIVLNGEPLQSANDRSRWCTVWSLVERGTFQIDEIDSDPRWSTIDKVRHRRSAEDPWHFYSSKPPLLSTGVAGLYWVVRQLSGMNLREETVPVARLLLFFVNAVPMFCAVLIFRRSLQNLHVSAATRTAMLVIVGACTMINPFLSTLNNHTPAVASLIVTLAAVCRQLKSDEHRCRDFFLIGFMAALTCSFELPAAIVGLLSFAFVCRLEFRTTLRCYVPGALIPLALLFIPNWVCTGGIKPFYAYYGTEKYRYVHEGIPSYWMDPQGIDANQESPWVYLLHCTFGHHGMFSLTPVFLLAVVGWFGAVRLKRPCLRIVSLTGAVVTVIVLAFYLKRTENYNYGGNTAALRWMIWVIPFWWYAMVPVVDRLQKAFSGRVILAALMIPSALMSMASLSEPWRPNRLYELMERRGWIDYRTKVADFSPERFSAIAPQLPPPPGTVGHWEGSGSAAGRNLEISVLNAITLDQQSATVWKIRAQRADGEAEQKEAIVIVADSAFTSGRDISSGIRGIRDNQLSELLQPKAVVDMDRTTVPDAWVVLVLRGLPTEKMFRSASPRYLQYENASGEKTAVRCERGAARVPVTTVSGTEWIRCDVLYSEQVPFGTARWVITTTDQAGQQLSQDIWTSQNLP
ncbi:MAG: hypothetical protein R3C49_09315 [Planctomycetaceae bacterium]